MKLWLRIACLLLGGISTASAQEAGGVSSNLLSLFSGINSIFSSICMVMGIGFILASFLQYKQHRMNKLLVPISKPIMWLILGVLLVLLPMLGHYTVGGTLVSSG